jgi:hypothetical protein
MQYIPWLLHLHCEELQSDKEVAEKDPEVSMNSIPLHNSDHINSNYPEKLAGVSKFHMSLMQS